MSAPPGKGFTMKSSKIKKAPAALVELPTPQEEAVSMEASPMTSSTKAMFAKPDAAQEEAISSAAAKVEAKAAVKVMKADIKATLAKAVAAAGPAAAAAPAAPAAPAAVPAAPTKTSKKLELLTTVGETEPELQKLGEGFLLEELEDPYTNPAPRAYVPETHRNFSKFIKMTYADFILPPVGEGPPMEPGDKYPYQKFIREYMRQASPYRGILVYHGLGSGKTCSAIAASEALFATANKKIIVMTPFSLRKNFLKEVSFCGFRHFRLLNYWVGLQKENPIHRMFALEILGLSEGYLRTATKIWVPDFDQKTPNYESLSATEQTEIRKQILSQLVWDAEKNPKGRIRFINYNGISAKKLKKFACEMPDFFDDAVIVVDEIHNLVRLIQGEIDPYLKDLPGKKRKLARETITVDQWKPSLCGKETNYRRGYLFYRLMLSARRSKIIGLSGTPLINFPEELGILANILHGYIPLLKGTLQQTGDQAQAAIKKIASEHPNLDFVSVERSNEQLAGTELTVTLLPQGIQKVSGVDGVERIAGGPIPTPEEVKASLLEALRGLGFTFRGELTLSATPLLHPFGDEFREDFLTPDGLEVKNKFVLGKRLTGLVSYYKGSRQDLMPAVAIDEVVRVPFSSYSQGAYSKIRLEEIDIEMKKKDKGEAGLGNVWGEVYDIGQMKQSSNYRMGSRQMCNFAFPTTVTRPRARNTDEEEMENTDDKDISDTVPDVPTDAVIEGELFDFPELDVAAAPEETGAVEDEVSETEEKRQIYAILARLFAGLFEKGMNMEDIKDKVEEGRQFYKLDIPISAEKLALLDSDFKTLRFTSEGFSGVEGVDFDDDLAAFTARFVEADEEPQAAAAVTEEADEEAEAEAQAGGVKIPRHVSAIRNSKQLGEPASAAAELDAAPAAAVAEPAEPVKKITLKEIQAKKRADAEAAAATAATAATAAPAPPAKITYKEAMERRRAAQATLEQQMAEQGAIKPVRPPPAAVAVPAVQQKQLKCKGGIQENETYKQALARSKSCLRTVAAASLKLNPQAEESLSKYSPKYAAILQRILDAPGSSLVYSQFLDMEGIGIFRVIMDINNFAPIEIVSTAEGPAFTPETEASLRKGPAGQMRYMTFSGEEKEDVRRMALDVFNARFGELPARMKTVLEEAGYKDNHTGQLCRVFCITSAGAEGLSLKNVRAVHIMEPYWNDVRLKQVKGRAIRIGSHLELPPEQRNVSIYTYISVFGEDAQVSKDKDTRIDETIRLRDIVNRDIALKVGLPIPASAASYVLTSDERLYVISERKKKVIEELETVMKGAAVDCELSAAENQDGTFQCLLLDKMVGDFVYEPELKKDIARTEYSYKEEVRLVKAIKWAGVKYWAAADKDDKGVIMGFTLYSEADRALTKALGTTGVANGAPAPPVKIF